MQTCGLIINFARDAGPACKIPRIQSQKVNRNISTIVIALAALLFTACGKKDHFTVQGRIDGLGAATVTLTYYADGGLKRITAVSEGDRFGLRGEASSPALAFLDIAGSGRMATLVVANGDKIKITGNADEPESFKISGSSPSSKIAGWASDNSEALKSGDSGTINASIAGFIGKNKGNTASTALLTAYFNKRGHEHEADSLFALLDPEVRTPALTHNFNSLMASQLAAASDRELSSFTLYDRSDSVITFSTRRRSYSLIALVGHQQSQRDSIIPAMKKLSSDISPKRLSILEISAAPDSSAWLSSVRPDTVSWRQTWEPAALSSHGLRRLAIPSVPFFIVTDSTGTQIYRGPSVSRAVSTIANNISSK